MTWDDYAFALCEVGASKSKDKKTKLGAVILGPDKDIRGVGYNGFPRGVNDDAPGRQERPTKYPFTVHAEANVIYAAAKIGTPLQGCTIYCPQVPCSHCTGALIQTGIRCVVIDGSIVRSDARKWLKDAVISFTMMSEASIFLRTRNSPLNMVDWALKKSKLLLEN